MPEHPTPKTITALTAWKDLTQQYNLARHGGTSWDDVHRLDLASEDAAWDVAESALEELPALLARLAAAEAVVAAARAVRDDPPWSEGYFNLYHGHDLECALDALPLPEEDMHA